MKRMFLPFVVFVLISNAAMADHIGIFSDATGTSCNLGPAGFNPTATVIHQFASDTAGSRFKITFPPGTAFISFLSPYAPCGVADCGGGQTFPYGQCLAGNVVIGTILAIYAAGTVQIDIADDTAQILYYDCSFAEQIATGGHAYVGTPGDCSIAVEPSTWGSVKALYR